MTQKTYVYQVLPFGWRLSPYVFCRVMQTLTRLLRTPGVPATGRGKPEGLTAAIRRACPRQQNPSRMRILPYMDGHFWYFSLKNELNGIKWYNKPPPPLFRRSATWDSGARRPPAGRPELLNYEIA